MRLLLVVCASLVLSACASTPGGGDLPELDGHFRAAYERNARTEAATALAAIATRFPTALPRYSDEVIERTASAEPGASNNATNKARLELLRALFAQRWKLRFGVEPSDLWRDLVTLLVESGKVNDAVEVVPHIQVAREMVVLRVDRRFEALMRLSAPVLSVESTAKLDVQNWREATRRAPRSAEAVVKLGDALLAAGSFEEALAITDEALAKSPARAFDDAGNMATWLYNNRSQALRGLGRWGEAETELRRSMELPERGGRNISNTINLAAFYVLSGRPGDAVATLGELAKEGNGRVSPYGMMQVKRVLCMAAVLRNDEAAVNEALAYLSKHRADVPGAYQSVLVSTNRGDEWARYMIERLRNPETRGEALRALQDYAEPPMHPAQIETRKRSRQLAARPDVRAVVAEVGVIERFAIPPP